MSAIGCDLSRYNVSFNPAAATGPIDFAIQKATEGYSYVDLEYENIWRGVAQIGIRGAYHYQRSDLSWQAQADHFLETAALHDYHIYALDVESINNTYGDAFFADTRRILDYWRGRCLKQIVLYTNASTYDLMYLTLTRIYGAEGGRWSDGQYLWISRPDYPAGIPAMPRYRTSGWSIHQYSYSGLPARWGTGGTRVDENVFNGTAEQMRIWAGVIGTEPPPGEPMATLYGRVNTSTLNIRTGPGTTYQDIGDLMLGDHVIASEDVGGWWRLQKAYAGSWTGEPITLISGMTVEARAAATNDVWAKASYIVAIAPPVEPPPPPPPEPSVVYPSSVTLNYADGITKNYIPE